MVFTRFYSFILPFFSFFISIFTPAISAKPAPQTNFKLDINPPSFLRNGGGLLLTFMDSADLDPSSLASNNNYMYNSDRKSSYYFPYNKRSRSNNYYDSNRNPIDRETSSFASNYRTGIMIQGAGPRSRWGW